MSDTEVIFHINPKVFGFDVSKIKVLALKMKKDQAQKYDRNMKMGKSMI